MKKLNILVFSILFGLSGSAFAHDLWILGKDGKNPSVDIIFGHHFPTPEALKTPASKMFTPIALKGEKQSITLEQKGKDAWHFVAKKAPKAGTYIAHTNFKNRMPFSITKSGKYMKRKSRKDVKEPVAECSLYSMYAKTIVTTGGKESMFSTKALGEGSEFTPLQKISDIKVGKTAKFRLTRNGKPVKNTEVFGTLGGYSKGMAKAFYTKTDLNGTFEFKPLAKGVWALNATVEAPSNSKDCELFKDKTSISFIVK